MTVDEMYQIMEFAVAKNTEQGYFSPQEFNLVINQAQDSYLTYLIGEYQQYKRKQPIPVVSFSQNERIRTSIAPLIYDIIIPVDSTTGISPFPYGFLQVDGMWGQYNFYNIRFTQQDRLQNNYRSVIDPIASNPIYLIKHEGFQFYPEDIGNARISYVQRPPNITWGYTEDGNGVPVYNATLSSQPVWSDLDIWEIIVRALAIVGVSLQMGVVMGYAQEIKQNGQ